MSIYICEICDQFRDSDFREIVETKTGLACRECYMSRIEEDARARARNDYYDGQGQSANPYPYSRDQDSDYVKYEWEMHRMWNKSLEQICNDILRRA